MRKLLTAAAAAVLFLLPGLAGITPAHAASNSNTAEDNFLRAGQAGFGSSTNNDGVSQMTWHNDADGTHSYDIITGNTAQFGYNGSAGTPNVAGDGIYSSGNDSIAEFSFSRVGSVGFYLMSNMAPDASSMYSMRANSNNGKIELGKRTGGSTTIEASAAYAFTAGTKYWLRENYDSSGHLKGRIWKAGTAEPSAWNLSWTDTGTALGANYSGTGSWASVSTTDTISVYEFSENIIAGTPAVPPTLNQPFGSQAAAPAGTSDASGTYVVANNEWGSSASPYTSVTDDRPGFLITQSAIAQTNGIPGAYTNANRGCFTDGGGVQHCTDSAFPVSEASFLTAGYVRTSANTTTVAGYPSNSYDDAYDVWYNTAANGSGTQGELMVWLNNTTDVQPAGTEVATGVSIGGVSYNVWRSGTAPGGTTSYQRVTAATSVSSMDLAPFAQDMVNRGYLSSSGEYLEQVNMGFEVWINGVGLSLNSFSACVNGSC